MLAAGTVIARARARVLHVVLLAAAAASASSLPPTAAGGTTAAAASSSTGTTAARTGTASAARRGAGTTAAATAGLGTVMVGMRRGRRGRGLGGWRFALGAFVGHIIGFQGVTRDLYKVSLYVWNYQSQPVLTKE